MAHWHDTSFEALHALAGEHGTPYFLYDADVVNARIRRVRDSLGGMAKIYYAVKSNPNLALLRGVHTVADGLDISSAGELEQGLLAGYDAADMSFAGPAKSSTELEAAIRAGVGCISIESPREIDECTRIARRTRIRAKILLRVNPLLANRAYGLKMGGRPVQFGIDEEELPVAEQMVVAGQPDVEFKGIHVYAGSQCFDPSGVIEGTRNTLRIAREVEERTGLRCSKINLGGGFGISHGEDLRELDVAQLSAGLVDLLRAQRHASGSACEFIFELGRYLTADAGIYVTRVIGSKWSRGKSFFTCDGGLHHHLSAAGTFGAALRTNFALRNLSRPTAESVVCSIAGPSCNPTDLLGVDIRLPQLREGDLVGVLRSGSYGLTASPILFLGRPLAPELIRKDGVVSVGRRSRRMADFN